MIVREVVLGLGEQGGIRSDQGCCGDSDVDDIY